MNAVYEPRPSPAYAHAPITEAVIEVRVDHDVEDKALKKIAAKLKPHYTMSSPRREIGFLIDNTTGGDIKIAEDSTGYRLASEDQADIVLLTKRHLTTARLPPYPGWEEFSEQARKNWEAWSKIAPKYSIIRLGVRFINRIDIPVPSNGKVNLDQYFTFQPRSDQFEKTLQSYLVQVRFETFAPNWVATITSAPVHPHPVPDAMSFILDIDVSREMEIPMHAKKLWATIDEARNVKNDLFERALTEKTKDLFR
ncbi:MAG: TIGR04255 family protein [Alphaproteobacteria bacterium]|nr:TIGR04255 family protein [Alphaproteobacteria bacterium]